jgi:hypothetical protein
MPFARLIGDSSTLVGTQTTQRLADTALNQPTGYWDGHSIYHVSSGNIRRINRFIRAGNFMHLDRVMSVTPVATDAYEIHTRFNAQDIHDAIDRAIEESFPSFFDTIEDESIILKEDTLEYDISTITNLWYVTKMWLERATTSLTGTAQASAAGYITAAAGQDLSGVTSSWKVSVYAGTGAGQLRSVSSADNTTKRVTPTAVWTTVPDTTSKYRLWDPTEQILEWARMVAVKFDAAEYPATMRFVRRYPSCYGLRLRIQCLKRPTALTTEASTTIVPSEYIHHKALSILYGTLSGDNRFDRARFAGDAEYHRQYADTYARRRAFRQPTGTFWRTDDPRGIGGVDENVGDPLNWQGR